MVERTQERNVAHSDVGDLYRGKYKDSTAGDAMHKRRLPSAVERRSKGRFCAIYPAIHRIHVEIRIGAVN